MSPTCVIDYATITGDQLEGKQSVDGVGNRSNGNRFTMKILFLHGWQSVPGGVKPTYLREQGCIVLNPSLDDDDFDASVRRAQREFDIHEPDCVVGSSRGGAVALNIRSGVKPLVLLCPAWKKWGKVKTLKANSVILHSRKDDIIPFEDSEELISRSKLASEQLIEVGEDHRLADASCLSVLLWACRQLVERGGIPLISVESEGAADGVQNCPESMERHVTLGLGSMPADCNYICDSCGEEIVIPLDLAEGSSQTYVEDCPVCCHANIIHVQIDEDGLAQVWSEPEQDHD